MSGLPRQTLPGREIILHPEDERVFDALLHQREPLLRYIAPLSHEEMHSHARPKRQVFRSTGECDKFQLDIVFADGDDWQPDWKWVQKDSLSYWALSNRGFPNGVWWRTRIAPLRDVTAYKGRPLEGLGQGQIYFRALSDEPEQVKRVQRLLRLIPKVASNRLQQVFTEREAAPILTDGPGGQVWIGHHALAWARESPDRLLGWSKRPNGNSFGFRPLD